MPIFSHIARAVSVLGVLYSLFMLYVSWNLSKNAIDPTAIRPGDLELRHGLQTLFGSLVLGMISEISLALHRKLSH